MNRDMHIKYPKSDPYGDVLNNFFFSTYPVPGTVTPDAVLEAVTSELVGTAQYRYGPRPNPESLVAIRDVIRNSVSRGDLIPMLVPFGGMKTNPRESVDVAELSAIKVLDCLNERVRKYYPPGLDIRIRIEDLGAEWLFRNQQVDTWIHRYSEDFAKLVRIVTSETDNIRTIKESVLMDRDEYFNYSDSYAQTITNFVTAIEAGHEVEANAYLTQLHNQGWKGGIPMNQREYYRGRYRTLYPGQTADYYNRLLGDYLGGAFARHRLGGRGSSPSWTGGFINLSFVPPVPGAPADMVSTYLYYRVVPQKYSRDSIAPWRGKGYLRVVGNVATPAVASWNADTFYNPFQVIFSDGNEEVFVGADYVVND